MKALDREVKEHGLIFMNEMGLDPGIYVLMKLIVTV
jgi:saccharopine dehydrogenase-like NADP-dependent oxidoreductase